MRLVSCDATPWILSMSRILSALEFSPKPGDVIGTSGFKRLDWEINVFTGATPFGGLSHVGIVADYITSHPTRKLFESTSRGDEPCEITGDRTDGVQAHGLRQRIEDFNGRVWHLPLTKPLCDSESRRLTAFLAGSLKKRYDFFGAAHARHTLIAWLYRRYFQEEDLDKLFCSELVAAALRDVGRIDAKLENVSGFSPNGLRRYLRRRKIIKVPRRVK